VAVLAVRSAELAGDEVLPSRRDTIRRTVLRQWGGPEVGGTRGRRLHVQVETAVEHARPFDLGEVHPAVLILRGFGRYCRTQTAARIQLVAPGVEAGEGVGLVERVIDLRGVVLQPALDVHAGQAGN